MSSPWVPSEETREWHAATTSEQCEKIEAALQAQGLDITFVRDEKTGNSILEVACIFDGPDSDTEADRWTSYQETD
jgi:hypothetical protein